MKISLALLASGLLTAVYAVDSKSDSAPLLRRATKCGYKCTGEYPFGCQNNTAHPESRTCQPFTVAGCYSDPKQTILHGNYYALLRHYRDNVHEKCAWTCRKYNYYAVSGKWCQCGDRLKRWAVEVAPVRCEVPCPGNSTQSCATKNVDAVYIKVAHMGDRTVNAPKGWQGEPAI
ncbi:hypothetical protein BM1_06565 [Bipolaris maydis]|nr:hypothetical protein BM1_06565 [Bipolaris maydis]